MKTNRPKPIAQLAGQALTGLRALATTTQNTVALSPPNSLETTAKQTWADRWLKLEIRTPAIQKLSEAVTGFCARWFYNAHFGPRVVVLAGVTGAGKTFAMRGAHRFACGARVVAAERTFWQWPPTVLWENWPPKARAIVEAGPGVHMADLLADGIEADLLFLDDIGADSDKFRSGENVDALCQLLGRREHKWTMITTNYLPEEWPLKFDPRVADRLWRNSFVPDLTQLESFSLTEPL